jgi:hypothetical protein
LQGGEDASVDRIKHDWCIGLGRLHEYFGQTFPGRERDR